MKKFSMLLALMLTLAGAESVSAQNWLDALKGIASEVIDEATGGKLTEASIIGAWEYKQPGVRMGSSDTLANLAGAAAESAVEGKLASAYEKIGIKPGFCAIHFKEDKSFVMTIGKMTFNGTYQFDASTHAITLTMGKLNIPFKGYAYIDGTNFELVFPVDKLVEFISAVGSKMKSLSTVTTLLQNYDEIYLGFQFAK